MNELQIIRSELAAQRRHAREVAASCTPELNSANIVFSDSYDRYLSFILDLESRRAASHLERLRSRSDLSGAERELIERSTNELETLCATHAAVDYKTKWVARLSDLSEELEAIAERRYGVADWRRAAHIDADSILEERRLRKQLLTQIHGRTPG